MRRIFVHLRYDKVLSSYRNNVTSVNIVSVFLWAANGKGFRNLIKEVLEIGSMHGVVDVDNLTPDPKTISLHVHTLAIEQRKQLKEQIELVRDFI